ncbi:2-phospho-L-lactate transferase [bacterium]|nr:2-phospho-L-lactate transferase [bacterium]
MQVAVLAGGVGGARLCHGLYRLQPEGLSLVVNTGDDFRLHGLAISPDLDTVLYTLAEWANPVQGWGLRDETWNCAQQLTQLGGESWFRLGDRDLATHLFRTHQLDQGLSLTRVMQQLAARAGLPTDLLWPMCDGQVRTKLRLSEGWVDFQDYFVKRQHTDRVLQCRYEGADQIPPTEGVVTALLAADRIVLAPSNPYLSLLPILSLQGMAALWPQLRARKVAVSPMIGTRAVKGPLASLLDSLGHPVSSLGIAQLLRDWIDVLIIDSGDTHLQPQIEALGLQVGLTPTLMKDTEDRERLARVTLDV